MKQLKQENSLGRFLCSRKLISCSSGGTFVLILGIVFCQICQGSNIIFHDVTKETGITFKHTDGSSGKRYIMETVSAGLALFDYDNDGDVDIYFLNGAPLKGVESKDQPRNELYRNDGGWKFTNVTEEARVGDTGYGLGVAVGDYVAIQISSEVSLLTITNVATTILTVNDNGITTFGNSYAIYKRSAIQYEAEKVSNSKITMLNNNFYLINENNLTKR